jgi:nitroreductase
MELLELIQHRHSSRVLFEPNQRIPEAHLLELLEAARWAPTAHNMQNFEVVVVDDPRLLEELAEIPQKTSQTFVEENYAQLSFSEEELKRRKTGLLATMFPPSWRTPGVKPVLSEEHAHSILGEPIKRCGALLLVLYDPSKRAPASAGDVLGMMSLGCVMENMWLVAESLGLGVQIQSALSASPSESRVKELLGIPPHLRIGFAIRIGILKMPASQLRVRRNIEDFTHRNRFGQHQIHR